MYRRLFAPLTLLLPLLLATACGQDLPFTYEYRSPDEVEIRLAEQTFAINRREPRRDLPFTYTFENDGDVDLVLEGRHYELESPYDLDSGGKKKAKRKRPKATSKR